MKKTAKILLPVMFSVMAAVPAFAAGSTMKITDQSGYEVTFNSDNYCVNAGNVYFRTDSDSCMYDDGGVISPVENGLYTMAADKNEGAGAVMFYEKSGDSLIPLSEKPYAVRFRDSINTIPEAVYTQAQSGKSAYMDVFPSQWVHTFISIDDGSGKPEKQLITAKTRLEFSEDGRYRVKVWNMDGRGTKTFCTALPKQIIIDNTPPSVPEISVDTEGKGGRFIFSKAVTFSAKSSDPLSGIKDIIFKVEGKGDLKGSTIRIEPPFRGRISAAAEDNAGNTSDSTEFEDEIIIDADAPVISVTGSDIRENILELDIFAEDELSGISRLRCMTGNDTVYEGNDGKARLEIDLADLPYGDIPVIAEAADLAGNESRHSITISRTDNVPPDINIIGIADNGIYGGEVTMGVETSDDSGLGCAYSAEIIRCDAAGNILLRNVTDSNVLRFEKSGHYTVSIKSYDRAGNMNGKTVRFIIDLDSPVISGISELNGKKLLDFRLADDLGNYVKDESFVVYDVYLNGLEYDGRVVRRRGKYVLRFTAIDEFGHSTDSTAAFTVGMQGKTVKESLSQAAVQSAAALRKPLRTEDVSAVSAASAVSYVPDETVSGSDTAEKPLPKLQQETTDKLRKKNFFERVRCAIIKILYGE